jgi:hypothetical protein
LQIVLVLHIYLFIAQMSERHFHLVIWGQLDTDDGEA